MPPHRLWHWPEALTTWVNSEVRDNDMVPIRVPALKQGATAMAELGARHWKIRPFVHGGGAGVVAAGWSVAMAVELPWPETSAMAI